MPVINRSSQATFINVTGGNFQPFSLAGATFTAGNWNGDMPTNLQAITDNDSNSATTWGRTSGLYNRGWIQVDLGSFFSSIYFEITAGIKMYQGWNEGNADWFCETSEIANAFVPIWQAIKVSPSITERALYLNGFASCRYLRLGCFDNGGGEGMLRWYNLRMWHLLL